MQEGGDLKPGGLQESPFDRDGMPNKSLTSVSMNSLPSTREVATGGGRRSEEKCGEGTCGKEDERAFGEQRWEVNLEELKVFGERKRKWRKGKCEIENVELVEIFTDMKG